MRLVGDALTWAGSLNVDTFFFIVSLWFCDMLLYRLLVQDPVSALQTHDLYRLA
jgi:hypothetical protein